MSIIAILRYGGLSKEHHTHLKGERTENAISNHPDHNLLCEGEWGERTGGNRKNSNFRVTIKYKVVK